LDFGAARAFDDSFVDEYYNVIVASANRDREGIYRHSVNLGFLTGEETEVGDRGEKRGFFTPDEAHFHTFSFFC
jgi:predicted unusual protein kinase regulating ubiquinone biosynthesis (AarF/ABC1/UbiB family)